MNYQRVDYPNGYKKIMQPVPKKEACQWQKDLMPPISPYQPPQMPEIPTPVMPQPTSPMMPKEPSMPKKGRLNLFTPDEGFKMGTIFRGVYEPYKNYQPMVMMPNTEQAQMMFDVDKYYFAMLELQFYLDNFPNDEEAIAVYTNFQKSYLDAKQSYEDKYGAIDMGSNSLNRSPWDWTMKSWPWEGEM